jgi:hypothetical protein
MVHRLQVWHEPLYASICTLFQETRPPRESISQTRPRRWDQTYCIGQASGMLQVTVTFCTWSCSKMAKSNRGTENTLYLYCIQYYTPTVTVSGPIIRQRFISASSRIKWVHESYTLTVSAWQCMLLLSAGLAFWLAKYPCLSFLSPHSNAKTRAEFKISNWTTNYQLYVEWNGAALGEWHVAQNKAPTVTVTVTDQGTKAMTWKAH